jgi:hypothetical protein
LVQEYLGKANVSLFLVEQNDVGFNNIQISVQLFDDSDIILMNLDEDTVRGNGIVIESNGLHSTFSSYYQKLIDKNIAFPVILDGKPDNNDKSVRFFNHSN